MIRELEIIIPSRVEAEDYCDSLGIQSGPTGDIGGGKYVGWIQNDDWMDYQIYVPFYQKKV